MEIEDIKPIKMELINYTQQKSVKIEGMEDLVRIMYNIGIELHNMHKTLKDIQKEVRTVASAGL